VDLLNSERIVNGYRGLPVLDVKFLNILEKLVKISRRYRVE